MAADAGDGVRRRRIDDARELQQQRRRQRRAHKPEVPPHPHQPQNEEAQATPPPPQTEPQHQHESDAHTLSSAPSAARAASASRSPASRASTRSTRRALSAKRQGMMQRRMERRRQEEQERQAEAEEEAWQLQQQQYRAQTGGQNIVQHPQHARVVSALQSPSGQPRHYPEQEPQYYQQPPAMAPQQYQQPYRGQMPHDPRAYNNAHPAQNYMPKQGNGRQNYRQGGQPVQPMHDPRHRQYHAAQGQDDPRYYQQQVHPQNYGQHSSARPYPYQPQPQPMAIQSPPMVQRKQQHGQMAVYRGGSHEYSQDEMDRMGGVYNRQELERSGIIRNDGHGDGPSQSQRQHTNTLRKFSPYDSPSDEWHGYHAVPHPQLSRNQYARSGPAQPGGQQRQQQYRHRPAAESHRRQQSGERMPSLQSGTQLHASMPAVNQAGRPQQPLRNAHQHYHHRPQTEQALQSRPSATADVPLRNEPVTPQQPQPLQQPPNRNRLQAEGIRDSHADKRGTERRSQSQPRHAPHTQSEPNWEDINEQHHDGNRRRLMARNLALKQKQQERQEREQRCQYEAARQQPQRQLALSPVEHLGNRSDQMRRKVGFSISPDRKGRAQSGPLPQESDAPQGSDSFHDAEDGGSIVSVSDQARRLEQAHVASSSDRELQYSQRGRGARENSSRSRSLDRSVPSTVPADVANQRRMQTQQQAPQPNRSNYVDEDGTIETVSVASLRKGWEGKQQKPRAKSTGRLQASPNRAFSVWEERANRIARARRREQQRELRKNIEDRWMQQRNPSSALLPPSAARSRGSLPSPEKKQSSARYHDGYQSEGDPRRRSHDHYHSGSQSQRDQEDAHEGQEVVYDDALDVDSAAIAPKDARQRLWDNQERLRAVLPQNESFDSIGDVRDRWPQEQDEDPSGGPQFSTVGSPSNRSGYSGASSAAGSRFKPKFIHAAALATQNRVANDHQQAPYSGELEEDQVQQHSYRPSSKSMSSHPQKNEMAASSHYTDSTAETTNITTPAGSFGSSHLRAAGRPQGNATRFVRKVSPSPPKRPVPHPSVSTMPSIDEAAPQTHTTSVAALIARINAVSRSNPEEALAAIDSIIEREGGGANTKDVAQPQEAQRGGSGGSRPSASRRPKNVDPFSPPSRVSRAVSPPAKQQEDNAARHLGKDFFQESYEEVLRTDSERVIHRPSSEMEGEEDDEDDSLLSSSAESTVSSMTDPTYQSLNPEKGSHRHSRRDPSGQSDHRTSSHHPYLLDKPQKSWNTLRREYNTRRMSPPVPEPDEEHNAERQNRSAKISDTRRASDDNVEEFNPDDIVIENAPADSAWVPFDEGGGGRAQSRNSHSRRQAPAQESHPTIKSQAKKDWQTTTSHAYHPKSDARRAPESMPGLISQTNSAPSQSGGVRSHRSTATPGPTRTTGIPPKRASTPELMMTVSDAFSNVDISLDVVPASSNPRSSIDAHDDPPLEHLQSIEGSLEEQGSPLQTISDAFSDVDINFEEEKTAGQRREQLKHLASSWTKSQSQGGLGNSSSSSFKVPPQKKPEAAFPATSWANEKPKKSAAPSKFKKRVEPQLRLKGNRSLARKFASLVKAYDD